MPLYSCWKLSNDIFIYNDFMKTLKTCDPLIYSQCPPGSNPGAECAWSSTRIAKIAKSEFTIAKSECEQASLPTTAHVQPHLGKYTLTIYPFSTCLQYTYYKSSYDTMWGLAGQIRGQMSVCRAWNALPNNVEYKVEAIMEPFRSPAGDRTWVL